MNIEIIPGIQGAQQATDIAVIIDVLRAASVAAYLLDAGVTSIVPVSTAEEAFQQNKDENTLLVGENKGIMIPGFDLRNSPSEIQKRNDLANKKVIHRSSTGTQGLVHARHASEIIFGSFVTAEPIIKYLRNLSNRTITLVPMDAYDDHMFAEYLLAKLTDGNPLSVSTIKEKISAHEWIQTHFLNPKNHQFPEEDFHLCIRESVFGFYPVVQNGKIVKSTQL